MSKEVQDMNANRIFKSTPDEIKRVIKINGQFQTRETSHITGYGGINYATCVLTVSPNNRAGTVYIRYDVYTEFGRFYRPLSGSYWINPVEGVIEDLETNETRKMFHISNPAGAGWASWLHAMGVYQEIFGEGGTE